MPLRAVRIRPQHGNRNRRPGPGSGQPGDRVLATPLPHLHGKIPGRLHLHDRDHKAAQIYSHLSALGWTRSLPKGSILEEVAQRLTRRFSSYRLRRLPLEFSLVTELKLLPVHPPGGDDCAIAVHAPDVQCLELQSPVLELEERYPMAGRYVWQALHCGLWLLGSFCSPATLLHLLSIYYWQGEDDEREALNELKRQGEDVSQIEMVRRADVDRQFPKWVLNDEPAPQQPPASLSQLPFGGAARRLLAFPRRCLPHLALDCDSIPMVYIPWEGSVMNQVADEHFNVLNQEYETLQFLFRFSPKTVESFRKALRQFRLYLNILGAVEDLLDGLLGAAEPRPLVIRTAKESPDMLAATHALLLYRGANTANRAVVTLHTVARGAGRYVLLPGQPATASALHQLLSRFNPTLAEPNLLPEHLLRHNPGELLWHCPSRVEPIYFQTTHPELNAISGKPARHPHLLFHATHGELHVAALPDEQRPTLQTQLLRAPYYNVSATGKVCLGSMTAPRENRPGAIPQWERAFFRSAFTHAQGGAFQITSHPQGHSGLWSQLTQQSDDKFPLNHLVPLKLNLSQWLMEHAQSNG